jgi:hypothetical protein
VHEQLHRGDQVEAARRRPFGVADGEGALRDLCRGQPDGPRIDVDAGHPCSAIGRGSREQARAAAEVEHGRAGPDPGRVEDGGVQRPPPPARTLVGHPPEPRG